MQPTGLPQLDEILEGGMPQGSSVAVIGQAGTGKTILALQWLFNGAKLYGENGIYIGFTESNQKVIANASKLSFYDEELVGPERIHFTDLRIIMDQLGLSTTENLTTDQASEIIDVIRHMVDAMRAKRVVLDSLTAFLYLVNEQDARRDFLFRLSNALSRIGATLYMTCEANASGATRFGVAEFIGDGIIQMTNTLGQLSMIRRLNVVKMRGTSFRSGPVMFDITDAGIEIFPKIPNYSLTAKTDFKSRKKTGVPQLDKLLSGGLPQGHVILIGGNTGTGKSTLAMHFAAEGITNANEACVFVALEESVEQLQKTAEQHGWDFQKWASDDRLTFITSELIDLNPDRLLYSIIRAVEHAGAKRVVLDSISSMENAAFDRTRVREFLLQLRSYLKSEGITCIMTYLTAELFGATENQLLSGTASTELGLSSMVDGILLLRYVERHQRVLKLMNILKLRGSDHEKGIIEYAVGQAGVTIKGQFNR